MKTRPPNLLDLPLHVRAEMALREAVEELIEQRAREGRTLVIWRNEQVMEIPAEQLLRELIARRKQAADSPEPVQHVPGPQDGDFSSKR